MAALTDLSDLINRATGGNSGTPENVWFYSDPRVGSSAATATVAGRWTSLWNFNSFPGGTSSAPGSTGSNPDNTTTGALHQTDATGGRTKWLVGGQVASQQAGAFVLYDRLYHVSGCSGTTTTIQTVSNGTVSRYTDAESVGNQIWVEIYSTIGTTGTTAVIDYINQDGSGRTTPSFSFGATGLREAQRLIMVPLAAGDTGVRSVDYIDLVASTGTAGDFGITIARPLLTIPVGTSGTGAVRDLVGGLPGPIEIKPGACLAWAYLAVGTTTPMAMGNLFFVEA